LLHQSIRSWYSEYAWNLRSLKQNVSSQEMEKLLTAKIIDEMDDFCRLNSVSFVVLELPFCDMATVVRWLPRDYLSRDIMILDPSNRMLQTPGRLQYIGTNEGTGHFTPLGNSVVAECLTEYLLKVLDEKEKGK